jgi:methionyl-tRNA formyltransferase
MTFPNLAANESRVVFMGSPDFAVPSLAGLVDDGYQVTLAVTQPDRPAGRGQRMRRPAIAVAADELGIPVYQPTTLRTTESRAPIEAERPDVIVVAAFGLLLPLPILDLPRRGCVNVHASLLPRHRGAAPIQACILSGDPETGITIMAMDAGMDTGGIISQRSFPLTSNDSAMELEPRLAALGRDLLRETLPAWLDGSMNPTPQDDALATYAPKIKRTDAEIDWTRSAEECDRAVRAFRGWPNAFTSMDGKHLIVLETRVIPDPPQSAGPGVVMVQRGAPWSPAVGTGSGLLQLIRVQPEGRRPMSAADLINGLPGVAGMRLGEHAN